MNAITRQELAELDTPLVSFSLNGREVTARGTETGQCNRGVGSNAN